MIAVALLTTAATIAAQAPPPGGVADQVATAIERGDENALQRLTRGLIFTRLTDETRSRGNVRLSAAELIALTRGCVVNLRSEPGSEASGTEPGAVGFRCVGRPAVSNACEDVGFGLLLHPQPDLTAVTVWPNDHWSAARCGRPLPPPPPAPPAPPPALRPAEPK